MTDIHFPDVTQLAIPLFIAALLTEILAVRFFRARGGYETRDTATSLIMGAGSVVSGIVFGFIAFGVFQWLWRFRLFDLGVEWWAILLCFVADDLRYYAFHRIAHRSRWVRASHVNHHSSQHYNLSTALRQTWTGDFTFMLILRAPLILLGFSPELVIFCGGLNLVYQFWIHTEAIDRTPRWFEAVFNTPSHHRVHHGRNARYLDANYAGVLIIWDRMFGTFVPEQKEEPVEYGLVANIGAFNPIRVAFHEYVAIFRDVVRPGVGWRARLMYVVAPPGWSHDGSRRSSAEIKADYVKRNPEAEGAPGL